MHLHFIGICGTFMSSLALMARQLGHTVTGCDQGVYPPISDVLAKHHIEITEGYNWHTDYHQVDCFIIGNVAKRGMPIIETILNNQCRYQSGPEWLSDEILLHKKVIAIAGTHGKTTTTSLVAWILQVAGHEPSYLIAGVPENFDEPYHLTDASSYFVIEADEYDTAFFDKRSKFVHYHPYIGLINNLEFDHADIFNCLEDIQKQFHHFVRLIPENGHLVVNHDASIQEVLDLGYWTKLHTMNANQCLLEKQPGQGWQSFEIKCERQSASLAIDWGLRGVHNAHNALAAAYIALALGIESEIIQMAINSFKGVKRRMQLVEQVGPHSIWDDFAHHPTAISSAIEGLSQSVNGSVIPIVNFASNSMRLGVGVEETICYLSKLERSYVVGLTNINLKLPHNIHPIEAITDTEMACHLDSSSPAHFLILSNKGTSDLIHLIQKMIKKGVA